MGGFVLAWWDFADASEHFKNSLDGPIGQSKKNSKLLAITYFVRAAATITLTLVELGTAVAIAKPLFDHLSRNARTKFVRMLASAAGSLAKSLGTQTARLVLARLVLGAFWAGLALTILIYLFEDDSLEKWCKRSSFRIGRSSNAYEEQEELIALHSAFREVS
jgi:hypothetical protein